MRALRSVLDRWRNHVTIQTLIVALLGLQALVVLPLQTWSHIYLYADGAYFLLMLLTTQKVLTFDWPRHFAHLITQSPIIMAISWLHVTNIRLLSYIYGFTLHLVPIVGMVFSALFLMRSKKRYYFVPIFVVSCYLSITASIYIMIEFHVALSIFWILMSILISSEKGFSIIGKLFLITLSIALIRVYEGSVLFAVIIGLLAITKIIKSSQTLTRSDQASLLICILASITSVAISCESMIHPAFERTLPGLIKSIVNMEFLFSPTFIIASMLLLLFAMFCFISIMASRYSTEINNGFVIMITFLTIVISIIGFLLMVYGYGVYPERNYQARVFGMVIPAIVGFVIWLAEWNGSTTNIFARKDVGRFAAVLVICLFCLNTTFQVVACRDWRAYSKSFVQVLRQHRGVVDYTETPLQGMKFNWNWTFPTMSILLSAIDDDLSIQTIISNKQAYFKPFDPSDPVSLPNLKHYGVSYKLPGASEP